MAHTSQTKLVVEADSENEEASAGVVTLEVTAEGVIFQTSRGRAVEIVDKDDLDAIQDLLQEALDGDKEPEKAQRPSASRAPEKAPQD